MVRVHLQIILSMLKRLTRLMWRLEQKIQQNHSLHLFCPFQLVYIKTLLTI